MARSGARVLIVERETKFRDRIRGEALQPWGVAEARKLGIAFLGHRCPRRAKDQDLGVSPWQ
jgi:hypothetical protein